MSGAYESLVGWRYLFRRDRRPRLLLMGVGLVLTGCALIGWAVYSIQSQGLQIQLMGMPAGLERNLLLSGVILCAIGGCVGLFGMLYYRMTVFSAFSTFMITIGVAEVILVLGIMSGLHTDLRNNIISSDAHVQIHPKRASQWMPDYQKIAKLARETPGVLGATPFVRTEVILNSGGNARPAVLMGIETDSIGQANKLPEQVKLGCLEIIDDPDITCEHWLLRQSQKLNSKAMKPLVKNKAVAEPKRIALMEDEFSLPSPNLNRAQNTPAILLGTELASALNSALNMEIDVISPLGDLGPSGPMPRSRSFKNGGLFSTKMLRTDETLAYGSIASVQRFLDIGDVASGIQISVHDLDQARSVRDHLRAQLPESYTAMDWQDRNHNLFTALKLERIVMFLVLTINILLAAFSITGTLVMTILERRREIAILMAMGSTRGSILRLFLSQGAFTGIVGSGVGATIGVGLGLALSKLGLPLNTDVYYIDAIPVDIRPANVVAIIGVAILVSMISTIYPARFASRVQPVEGLNAE